MGEEKTGRILYYPDIPWEDLYSISCWTEKPYQKKRYYRNIIALDTETAKAADDILFITDWTLTIEEFGCIYGNSVSDLMHTLSKVTQMIETSENALAVFYCHNFSYDYMFLRNHLIQTFGEPTHSLATKPHKYVTMTFSNGMEFRDSYILSGRSLEKFCKDMGTSVQKHVGSWDYNKFRTPNSGRTKEEIYYVCADTIALVLALREFMRQHKCNTSTCEFTNTGFVRSEGLKASKKDVAWRRKFRNTRLTVDNYNLLDDAFHGGYTHANRYHIGEVMHDIISYDFTSSYPARMLYNKYPMGRWICFHDATICDIMELEDVYAFAGHLLLVNPEVDKNCPMPPISKHKCKVLTNPIVDNGRIVKADLLIVPFTDPDLKIILEYYSYDYAEVKNVICSEKEYLPDWFCDMIMKLFQNKTTQKGKDNVLYMLSKGMLNSLYGMSVQKIVRDDIKEDFTTAEWIVERAKGNEEKAEEKLEAFYNNRKKYLPFQWGVFVTAYAQAELFKLGKLCKDWIYSDTDSVKGSGWNMEGLKAYNDEIRKQAQERGYGTIEYKGKEYTLGVAEFDGLYSEFVTLGSKRYCYREDGELHITVAGVPKIGVSELENDIHNFKRNMVFRDTNKKAATYIYKTGIHTIDINGEKIEYGCSVRLDDVEYTLDQTLQFDKKTGMPYKEFLY